MTNRTQAERQMLIRLHETEGIGWLTIQRLTEWMGTLEDMITAEAEELCRAGISAARARRIREEIASGSWEAREEAKRKAGIRTITVWDPEYPPLLRETARPPWVLYVKGDCRSLSLRAIAIVGTRTPTAYGRRAAAEFASELARAGVAVASGLARGIDGAAHEGALRAKGVTVAVLGTGFDRIYPVEHANLAEAIAASGGALVTEYPFGTPSRPGLFPQRNRIIAGMSLGTIVVEAGMPSGALITADYALQASREVFAVPGPIYSPKSLGSHRLIQDGARLIASVGDIWEEFAPLVRFVSQSADRGTPERESDASARPAPPDEAVRRPSSAHPNPLSDVRRSSAEWTPDERRILDIVGFEPVTFDRILEETLFRLGHLHSVLLSLTMKKVIMELPGPSYIRIG